MFFPEKMVILYSVFLRRNRDKVVRALQNEGIVEIESVTDDLDGILGDILDKQLVSDIRKINTVIMKLTKIIEILSIYMPEKTSLIESISGKNVSPIPANKLTRDFVEISDMVAEIERDVVALQREKKALEDSYAAQTIFYNIKSQLSHLGLDFSHLGNFGYTTVIAGKASGKNIEGVAKYISERKDRNILFFSDKIDRDMHIFVIISPTIYKEEIIKELKLFDAEIISRIPEVDKEPSRIKEEILLVESKLRDIAIEKIAYLWAYKETLENIYRCYDSIKAFGFTDETAILKGWVSDRDKYKAKRIIEKSTEGYCVVKFVEIPKSERKNVPVKLNNNIFVKPFEVITTAYGVPRYDKIDPTPLVSIFYPIFVGFMIGDAGLGLLLLFLTAYLYWRVPRYNKSLRDFLQISMYSALSAIIFGLLFGSFFGDFFSCSSEFPGRKEPAYGIPFPWLVCIEPLFMDPLTHSIVALGFVIFIGFLHVNIGLIIGFFESMRSNEWDEFWNSGAPFLLLQSGVFILLYQIVMENNMLSTIINNVGNIFSYQYITALENLAKLATDLLGLAVLPVLVLIIISLIIAFVGYIIYLFAPRYSMVLGYIFGLLLEIYVVSFLYQSYLTKIAILFIFTGIYIFYVRNSVARVLEIPAFMGTISSYARLLALGLATSVIGMSVNIIAGNLIWKASFSSGNNLVILGATFIFVIMEIVGQVANFGMNIMGAFIHALRLHYVEFFGGFYTGGGRLFNPLRKEVIYLQDTEER